MPFQQPQHPAWYGSVMGTGSLSLVLATEAQTWNQQWLTFAAVIALLLASALGIFLLPRYVRRARNMTELMTEIANPSGGPMLATLPAGLLVLSIAWGRVGPDLVSTGISLWISVILLALGAVLATAFSLTWALAILHSERHLADIHGGWLIPPVMNLLVPVALAPIIVANPAMADGLLFLGFAFYGIGLLLFLGMFTLLVARMVVGPAFAGPLAPSLWIPLAPAGLLGLAVLRLQQSIPVSDDSWFGDSLAAGIVASAVGIGFGLWWALFSFIEFTRIHKTGSTPVQPGWWGMVFPIGTMTLAISVLGLATGITAIEVLGALGAAVLTLCWIYVAKVTLTPSKGSVTVN